MPMSQFGVGLRTEHFPYFEEGNKPDVDWFEVISENFLNQRGRPWEILQKLRADYPFSLHGVSLSIASDEDLNLPYLKKLKELIRLVEPTQVSDHLCWTGLEEGNLHNLLPFVYDNDHLDFLIEKVDKVQNYLGRQILLENLSAYFSYKESTMTEWEFLRELSHQSGCGILLDVNNIYVNSRNQKFDGKTFIDALPETSVKEIHLAGYSDFGTHLFDTHSNPVFPEVWELYRYACKKFKSAPTLVEWDEDIPEFHVLEAEAHKARKIWSEENGQLPREISTERPQRQILSEINQ